MITSMLLQLLRHRNTWIALFCVLVVASAWYWVKEYGDEKYEAGYTEGFRVDSVAWSIRYNRLLDAYTTSESTLTVARQNPAPITGRRGAPADTTGEHSRIVGAFLAGVSYALDSVAERYAQMQYTALLSIDTTQTVNGIDVRTRALVTYYPPLREWYYDIQPSPVITETWRISQGRVVFDTTTIRYDWDAQVMLGWAPGQDVRVSPSLWYRWAGVGLDLQNRWPPIYRAGIRWRF